MRFTVICVLCFLLSTTAVGISSAQGQQPAETRSRQEEEKPAAGNAAAERGRVLLREGTEVHLKLAQTMTSKTSTVGEPVEMVLAEDLTIGEDVVVRKGARVLGAVVAGKQSEKQKSEAHELRVRADHIKVGDSFIKLTGDQAGIGKRDKEKMVTYSILFGLSGLLASSGKTFVIPEGTPAIAYVQEDIALATLPANSNGSPR
jgi:hypothetical protein